MLSRLHATIAQVGLNINAEALDSNAHRSCVLLDVDPTDDPAVFQRHRGHARNHSTPYISSPNLQNLPPPPSLTADETRGQVDQHESDIHAASSFIADFTGHSQRSATAPSTRFEPLTESIHGFEVRDDFRWLEPLESESEEVKAWTDLQNQRTRTALDAPQTSDGRRSHRSRSTESTALVFQPFVANFTSTSNVAAKPSKRP